MRFTLIFLMLTSSVIAADSLALKKQWVFVSLSYNIGIGQGKVFYHSKFPGDESYAYDRMPFTFKTPGLALGYLYSKNRTFFKVDLGYTFGTKRIDQYYASSSLRKDSYISEDYLSSINIAFKPEDYQKGQHFYRCYDHVIANLNIHYVDLSAAIGARIFNDVSLYFGFRWNSMRGYNYRGQINREAKEYVITNPPPQPTQAIGDSLIGSETIVYNSPFDLNALITQNIDNNFYLNCGVNTKIKIAARMMMVDLIFDLNMPRHQTYNRRDYVTIKLAYCFLQH
jgi:hypothetical protein